MDAEPSGEVVLLRLVAGELPIQVQPVQPLLLHPLAAAAGEFPHLGVLGHLNPASFLAPPGGEGAGWRTNRAILSLLASAKVSMTLRLGLMPLRAWRRFTSPAVS